MAYSAFSFDAWDEPVSVGIAMLGDVSGDGIVNSNDLFWFDFVIGSGSESADVNRDQILDNNDKSLLQQYINGEIQTFF